MRLYDTVFQTYDGFTLDVGSIKAHSADKCNIELPYCGALPEQFKDTSNPRIYFNVQAVQGAKVLLLADRPKGKKVSVRVDTEEREIKDILTRFFYLDNGKTRFDCGLTPYWLGIWAAHFMEWERANTMCGTLLTA